MRIIQLTDPHLFRDARRRLRGVPTNESFDDAVTTAFQTMIDSDLCIVTGDIAQDENIETYRLLRRILAPLGDRLRVLPGNHDRPDAIREVFGDLLDPDAPKAGFVAEHADAIVVGLDSHVEGAVDGEIGGEQLAWLEGIAAGEKPLVVFVHHPPVATGTRWLDAMGLRDGDRLLEALGRTDTKVCVVHGHTHQESFRRVGDIDIYGTPSTAFQFKPGGEPGETEIRPPGFRVLVVEGNAVNTRVHRLATTRFEPRT